MKNHVAQVKCFNELPFTASATNTHTHTHTETIVIGAERENVYDCARLTTAYECVSKLLVYLDDPIPLTCVG